MTILNELFNTLLQWREPLLLWALILPAVFWGIIRLIQKKQQHTYADAHLWPWVEGSNTSQMASNPSYLQKFFPPYPASMLLTLAWVCLIIALAGPRSLIETPNTQNREGIDLLVSMDLSHSMTADDRYPNRFLFAKSLVETMQNQLEKEDRLALQAFAGQPHIVSPLSHDHALFQHMLNLLEPNLLPLQGTWIERALIEGLEHLSHTDGHNRVIVLFTNGAPEFWKPQKLPTHLQNSPFFRAASALEKQRIKLIIVGVGDLTPSPLSDPSDAHKILQINGQPVLSKLEEKRLKTLSQHYGGMYLRAHTSASFMQDLLKEITDEASQYPSQNTHAVWQDYAQPFIVIGLILLLMAFYPPFVKLGRRPQKTKENTAAQTGTQKNSYALLWLSGLLTLSLYSAPQTSYAQDSNQAEVPSKSLQQAYHSYQQQQYEQSLSQYRKIKNYQGAFGSGSSAYKLGNVETAVFYFRQAAWLANTDLERAKALFNLGNSYYQIQLFDFAILSYQQALHYQDHYSQAQNNLTLAQAQKIAYQQANQNKNQGEKGKGDGTQSPDTDGAFYGGQQPNSSNTNESGFGSDGDAPEGNKQGNQVIVSDTGQAINYQLSNSDFQALQLNDYANQVLSAPTPQAKNLVEQQHRQQLTARFKQQIEQLEDNQKTLLKRLFEREAGFHAPQDQPHSIPGVQPW